jgi:glycosyltransferase involved in cell wall biosynthesis
MGPTGRHVVVLTWRDTGHPQGGGSERYVEHVARGLVRRGYLVTVCCSAYAGAPAEQTVDGVRFRRRGNDLTVYFYALLFLLRTPADLVVDVQNGLPFLSRLVVRCPVLVLVHHLHREQWRIVFGPVVGRVGWWIESWLAPRVYRRCRYVTVSGSTRSGLVGLGVDASRLTVVRNGLEPVPPGVGSRDPQPLLVAVSRLAPHKRLEHAIEAVARLAVRWPGLRLELVGQGPWLRPLREHAERLGVADRVVFRGRIDEGAKHAALDRAWVHLCPSVREGWGIVVMEAAAHGVPTVAYRSAGGVAESVRDGVTGLLAEDLDSFVAGIESLLADPRRLAAMAEPCRDWARRHTWAATAAGFTALVDELVGPDQLRRRASMPARTAGHSSRRIEK